jgi:hypothetical protein
MTLRKKIQLMVKKYVTDMKLSQNFKNISYQKDLKSNSN